MRAPRHSIQILASLNGIPRLAEGSPVQNHVGVTRNNQAIRGRGRGGTENVNLARRCLPFPVRHRMTLLASVLKNLEVRVPTAQLIDARNNNVELNPQLRKDLPPLRRPRR
jgi:hypothetical protein